MSLFTELRRRSVFKVGVAYAIVGWLLMQVAATAFPALQLPPWTVTFVAALLIIGFPIAMLLAWAYELTPDGIRPIPRASSKATYPAKHPGFGYFVTAIIAGTGGAGLFWLLSSDTDAEWLRSEVIPEIEDAIIMGDWEVAYALAREAQARIPDDPELAELWSRFAWRVTIPSDPPGATVYRRPYSNHEAEWEMLGLTPIEQHRIPYGLSRLRFELDGYLPLERTIGGGMLAFDELPHLDEQNYLAIIGTETFKLDTVDTLREGKVRVPGWSQMIAGELVEFRDFSIDRYEVTNAEFKTFVDAGGYRQQHLWDPIVIDGEIVPWDQAIEIFTDSTDRPGPSTWTAGDYPVGEENFPVSGVSWYEAAAYSRFIGEELPTVHHWRRAMDAAALTWLLPASNLDSSGPRAVDESEAMSYAGTFDMAGNVREWTSTASGDQFLILGGSWNDANYIAWQPESALSPRASPLDRAPGNGFRLAITNDDREVTLLARAPLLDVPSSPVYEPISDEVFAAYGRAFEYEKVPLNASINASEETRVWTRQRILFDAAYSGEQVVLYLFLPNTGSPPFQTVVYWPGASAFNLESIDEYSTPFDFLLKDGRAVAVPVYKDTFERGDGGPRPSNDTIAYRDNAIAGIKDLRRSIDYLETRLDIDHNALAYFGHSWGGLNGPAVLTHEPRLSLGMIYVGFLNRVPMSPEVDPFYALPRIHVPVLMLSGEFDSLVPLDNARRYFDLIGTPDARKRHVIEPGGHFVPPC